MKNFLTYLRGTEPSDSDVVHYAISGDRALNDQYGYGLTNPQDTPAKFAGGNHHHFGWHANMNSARFALRALSTGSRDVETIANAIHRGWSKTAKEFVDPVYKDKPEKRSARMVLAATPYHKLSEDEKEKDRVLAKTFIAKYDHPKF